MRRRAACSARASWRSASGWSATAAIGDRLGRNARFASIGNGIAAAAMGAIGYFFSAQAVFFVTAALLIPTLFALSRIQPREVDPELAHGGVPLPRTEAPRATCAACCASGRCSSSAVCAALFHLANASMLPLMASVVTTRSGEWATVLIAACIVVPQIVVALISPWVGHQAQIWGRRWFLLAAFAALARARTAVRDRHRSRSCSSPCSCSTASRRRRSA